MTTIVFIDEIDESKYVKLKPFQVAFSMDFYKYFYNNRFLFPKYQDKIYYIKMKDKIPIFCKSRMLLASHKHISLDSIDGKKKLIFQSLLRQYRYSAYQRGCVAIPKHVIDKYRELGYHFPEC